MHQVVSSMRLKVKGDTIYVPQLEGGVYFHNNESSFWMEGTGIELWLEKLLPLLNGQRTLGELTEGLPEPHARRVYDIAQVLYQNGFALDVSHDAPHHLSDAILTQFSPQIAFVDNMVGQGANRFEQYRNSQVLLVGDGSILSSAVSALFESGLAKVTIIDSGDSEIETAATQPAGQNRKDALLNRRRYGAHKTANQMVDDGRAGGGLQLERISIIKEDAQFWKKIITGFDIVLFVSAEANVSLLEQIELACKEGQKFYAPAICTGGRGLAGPVYQGSKVRWRDLWRRYRSSTAGTEQAVCNNELGLSILANVLVFEVFKQLTGIVHSADRETRFYELNLNTLEGQWQSFQPHPFVGGNVSLSPVSDVKSMLHEPSEAPVDLAAMLDAFTLLTQPLAGILHLWDEGDLNQLSIAQCRVQASNPLCTGPCDLLPEETCVGLTHEDARREAGLVGLEAYVDACLQHLTSNLQDEDASTSMAASSRHVESCVNGTATDVGTKPTGVGIGGTPAEALWRGIHRALVQALQRQIQFEPPELRPVTLIQVDDDLCTYYLQVLRTAGILPSLYAGPEVYGFPTVWLHGTKVSYGSIGLNHTMALRRLLEEFIRQTLGDAKKLEMVKDSQRSSLNESIESIVPDRSLSHAPVAETGSYPTAAIGLTPDTDGNAMVDTLHHTSHWLVSLSQVEVNDEAGEHIVIGPCHKHPETDDVELALQTLIAEHVEPVVFAVDIEPLLRELFGGVYSVTLRQGVSS